MRITLYLSASMSKTVWISSPVINIYRFILQYYQESGLDHKISLYDSTGVCECQKTVWQLYHLLLWVYNHIGRHVNFPDLGGSLPISRPIFGLPILITVKKSWFLNIPNAITKILSIFRFSLEEAIYVDIIRLFRDQQK